MYLEENLKDFLEKVKSKDMPGGGAVAAYTGSLGAALTLMVANLSYGKKRYESKPEEIKEAVEASYQKLEELIDQLVPKMAEDASSFDGVLEAMKMPKDTEEEKAARKKAMAQGYVQATLTPLETAEIIVEMMETQRALAEHGDIYAITDQGVGTLLLAASGESALLNVIINLKSMEDSEETRDIKKRHEAAIESIHRLKKELMDSCYHRLDKME